ncbi:MAG: membrane dipeptidase [Phocaeicola sp.]
MQNKLIILALLLFYLAESQAQGDAKALLTPMDIFHQKIDSLSSLTKTVKPIIGLSSSTDEELTNINSTYVQSVIIAGGTPVIIPLTNDVQVLRSMVSQLDGIVFTGSEYIGPAYCKEEANKKLEEVDAERNLYDFTLLKLATDFNVPTLGICRGLQLINVAFNGTLYQDIPSQHPSETNHCQKGIIPTHTVTIAEQSVLRGILGTSSIETNTFHHQGIKDLAPNFRAVAWSNDSIIEAIEAYPERPIMAVQFHPERMTATGHKEMEKFFRFLVNKADTFRLAKEIHQRILSIDTHTDTPMEFSRGRSIGLRQTNQVSIQKMEEGKLDAQFLAAFLGQKERDDASSQIAVEKTFSIINDIYEDVAKYKDYCDIALTPADAYRLKAEGKKAFFIGVENGYCIGKDLRNIKKLKELGVNYISLCHSYDNDICNSSTYTEDASKGLTDFGRKVIKEMNRLGMMIDISHASEGTFWDVIKLSKQPIMASHSSVRSICDHDRNLTDEQLKAIAKNGGVVQVCLLHCYINENARIASVCDAVEHIDHIVKVAGIDYVGIGSDFDGGGGLIGCNGDNDLINITIKLLEKGYTEEDISKIWGKNIVRVMNEVQKAHPFPITK